MKALNSITKKMKQTLILLGLAAGVICDSTIKQRLGQVKAKTLAE
jgi:hypothetical protein